MWTKAISDAVAKKWTTNDAKRDCLDAMKAEKVAIEKSALQPLKDTMETTRQELNDATEALSMALSAGQGKTAGQTSLQNNEIEEAAAKVKAEAVKDAAQIAYNLAKACLEEKEAVACAASNARKLAEHLLEMPSEFKGLCFLTKSCNPFPNFHMEERKSKPTLWEITWSGGAATLKTWTSLGLVSPDSAHAFLFWTPPKEKVQRGKQGEKGEPDEPDVVTWDPHCLFAWLGNNLNKEQIEDAARLFCQLASSLQKSVESTEEMAEKVGKAKELKEKLDEVLKQETFAIDRAQKEKLKGSTGWQSFCTPAFNLMDKQFQQAEADYKKLVQKKKDAEKKKDAMPCSAEDDVENFEKNLQRNYGMQGFPTTTMKTSMSADMPTAVQTAFCRRPNGMPAVNLISVGYGSFVKVYHVFLTHGVVPKGATLGKVASRGLAVQSVSLVLPADLFEIRKRLHGVYLGITDSGQKVRFITASASPLEIACEVAGFSELGGIVTIKQGYGQVKADMSPTTRPEARWWKSVEATVEKSPGVKKKRMAWQYGNSKYGLALLDTTSLNVLRFIQMGGSPSFAGLWLTAPIANVGFCGDGMATDALMVLSASGSGFTVPARPPPGRSWLAATPVPIQFDSADSSRQQISTELEDGNCIEPLNRIIQKGDYGWVLKKDLTAIDGVGTTSCKRGGEARMAPSAGAPISFSYNAEEVVHATEVPNVDLATIDVETTMEVEPALVATDTASSAAGKRRGSAYFFNKVDEAAPGDRKTAMDAVKHGLATKEEALRYLNIAVALGQQTNGDSSWVCISKTTRTAASTTMLLPAGCWGGKLLAAALSSGSRLHFQFDGWRGPGDVSKICCSQRGSCTEGDRCCAECTCKMKAANVNQTARGVDVRTTRVIATASFADDASVHLCDPSVILNSNVGTQAPGARVTGCSFQPLPSLQAKLNFDLWDATGKARTTGVKASIMFSGAGNVAQTAVLRGPESSGLTVGQDGSGGGGGGGGDADADAGAGGDGDGATEHTTNYTGKEDGEVVVNPAYDKDYLDVSDDTETSTFDANQKGTAKSLLSFGPTQTGQDDQEAEGSTASQNLGDNGSGAGKDDDAKKRSASIPRRASSITSEKLTIYRFGDKYGMDKDEKLQSKDHQIVSSVDLQLSDQDRYWFEYKAPDACTYMYLWNGENRIPQFDGENKNAGFDHNIEKDFFERAQSLGAVAQVLAWPLAVETSTSSAVTRESQSNAKSVKLTYTTHTTTTQRFLECLVEAQPSIVQHSASEAANRDFCYFSKSEEIQYGYKNEKGETESTRADRRDGMNERDKVLAIAARVPGSPWEIPEGDQTTDSRDDDDYSVSITVKIKELGNFGIRFGANESGKTEVSSLKNRFRSRCDLGSGFKYREVKEGYILKTINTVEAKDHDEANKMLAKMKKGDKEGEVTMTFDVMINVKDGMLGHAFVPGVGKQCNHVLVAEGSGWGPGSGVWRIENIKDLVVVDKKERGQQFSASSSYLICYTFKTPDGKDAAFIYTWEGVKSTQDHKGASQSQAQKKNDAMGGSALQVRVVMNKEPAHFLKIFGDKIEVYNGAPLVVTEITEGMANGGDVLRLQCECQAVDTKLQPAVVQNKCWTHGSKFWAHGSKLWKPQEFRDAFKEACSGLEDAPTRRELKDVYPVPKGVHEALSLGKRKARLSNAYCLLTTNTETLQDAANVKASEITLTSQIPGDAMVLDTTTEIYIWLPKPQPLAVGARDKDRRIAAAAAVDNARGALDIVKAYISDKDRRLIMMHNFAGAGKKVGLEIWRFGKYANGTCITPEASQRAHRGMFLEGSSYLFLDTMLEQLPFSHIDENEGWLHTDMSGKGKNKATGKKFNAEAAGERVLCVLCSFCI